MTGYAALLPAYDPDPERFLPLVEGMRARFGAVVAVDDGSSPELARVFEGAGLDGCVVHGLNRGKGAAIKSGIAWIRDNLPSATGIVTVDSDGQHAPEDAERVAAASAANPGRLVLGTRNFLGRGVPLRSRIGNLWSVCAFRLRTGFLFSDTQTGLRAFARAEFGRLLSIPGDRYEYETRMLVDAVRWQHPPLQIPVSTIYIDGNSSSHFRPLRDTFATQRALWTSWDKDVFKPADERKDKK